VDSALSEEIGLIDHARASLRSGNANATLQQVSDYDRRFVAGRFAPEALYLKMEALLKLGKNQAASVAAQSIIDRYPQGPQVGRAREVLRQLNNSNYP
jgi:outer membrane protein assembly factor BamD (BamD/ComL family)